MRGGDSATGAVVAAWEALAPDGGGGGARCRDGLSTFHIYSFTAHLPGCLYLGMTGRSWPLCSASSPSTPTSGPTSKVSTPSSRRPNLTLASYRKLSPTMLAATFCYTLTASTLRQASRDLILATLSRLPTTAESPAWESPAGDCWDPSLPPMTSMPSSPASGLTWTPPSPLSSLGISTASWTPWTTPWEAPCPSLDRILQTYSYTDFFRSLHLQVLPLPRPAGSPPGQGLPAPPTGVPARGGMPLHWPLCGPNEGRRGPHLPCGRGMRGLLLL